jgi:YgiT-type zinc finger domain-containing protein
MDERFQDEETKMKCIHCQGKLRKGSAPLDIDRHGYHLRLDRIPAWVCTQCGEPCFEESAVDSIQKFIQSVDKQADRLLATA